MANSISTNLFERWQTLQLREQRVIIGGVSIVLLTALFLSINYFSQVKNDLLEQQQELTTKFEWMLEQAELASSLGNNCPSQASVQTAIESLQSLAQTQQLSVISLDSSNSKYRLSVRSNTGNNILRFAHQSSCLGFELLTLSITELQTEGLAENQIELNQFAGQLEFNY